VSGRVALTSPRPAGRVPGPRPVAGPPWWRSRRALGLAAALATLLGAGGWVVGWTSLLGVRTVAVTGVRTVPAGDVLAAAAVARGEPLARVNTGAVARRVGAIPGVARVAVTRSWPCTVRIAVTERRGVAVVSRAGTSWLVDGGGTVFQRLETVPAGLPRLEVRDVGPDDPATRAGLSALAALAPAVRAQVRVVTAGTPEAVRLRLSGGRTVVWGDTGDAAAKAQAMRALLGRPGRTYDVSTPEVVTVR
jgi:cell division protein FtsQ